MTVANEPGEKILPGELGKGSQILADGGEIDYVGATNVELIGAGEAAGTYRVLRDQGRQPTRPSSSADSVLKMSERPGESAAVSYKTARISYVSYKTRKTDRWPKKPRGMIQG